MKENQKTIKKNKFVFIEMKFITNKIIVRHSFWWIFFFICFQQTINRIKQRTHWISAGFFFVLFDITQKRLKAQWWPEPCWWIFCGACSSSVKIISFYDFHAILYEHYRGIHGMIVSTIQYRCIDNQWVLKNFHHDLAHNFAFHICQHYLSLLATRNKIIVYAIYSIRGVASVCVCVCCATGKLKTWLRLISVDIVQQYCLSFTHHLLTHTHTSFDSLYIFELCLLHRTKPLCTQLAEESPGDGENSSAWCK